jgi:SAM-dependent methyltransferase
VLDIGCGSGFYLQQLQQLGWDVYGVEPNPAAAAAAVELLGVPVERIQVQSADEADWPPGHFDLITLSHVLEHLADPRRALSDIHRWLARAGRVRIWVPNVDSLEARLFGKLWFALDVPRHLVHYSPATISRMLSLTGFKVQRLVPEYQASSLSGSLSHLLDAMTRRRRRYVHSSRLYLACVPIASLLLGLGLAASIDVTAAKT